MHDLDAEEKVIAALSVKQSGGDIHMLAELLPTIRGRLQVLTAVDDLLYPSFMLGAAGAIAAVLTIVPDLAVALWDACQRGDHATARSLPERPHRPAVPYADHWVSGELRQTGRRAWVR